VAGDLAGIVGVFADAQVEFIVIGGLAAQAHGAARLTQDADFIYRRSPEMERSRRAVKKRVWVCDRRRSG
jgi:hypothetical protein